MDYLSEIRSALKSLSKETVIPALTSANKAFTSFIQNQLAPALAAFTKDRLIPAMSVIKLHVTENAAKAGGLAKDIARQAFAKTWELMKNNPGTTIISGIGSLVLLSFIADLALIAYGLGPAGPRSGSAAASYQRRTGSDGVAKRSVFAIVESAAMGGYGVATLRRWRNKLVLIMLLGRLVWYFGSGLV